MNPLPLFPRLVANKYELGEELGHGGMGTVYVAYDTLEGRRPVALKTISGNPDQASIDYFLNELDILKKLSHPNVVDVFASGSLDERGTKKPFFVMPLLEGQTLDKRLASEPAGRLSVETALDIIEQVANGLLAAHEKGIVHRDLKPGNIFLLRRDAVKIIDFGVAQLAGSQRSSQFVTLWYTAPEVFDNSCSALSDQFSLGTVFYEILTGARAFEGDNPKTVIDAISRIHPKVVSKRVPEVPLVIGQIVHKMISKVPSQRFPSMHEVLDALRKARRGEAIECFNPENFRRILQAARTALDRRNFKLAGETLDKLDAHGYVDEESINLRRDVSAAILVAKVRSAMEDAATLADGGDLEGALHKIESALTADPDNIHAAAQKTEIERRLTARKIETLKGGVAEHLRSHRFEPARKVLNEILSLDPLETEALRALGDIEREERKFQRLRQFQIEAFGAAQAARQRGELQTAMSHIERVIGLDDQLGKPDGGKTAVYARFATDVRSRLEALDTTRENVLRLLDDKDFEQAKKICKDVLIEDPHNSTFLLLLSDAEERNQRALLETIAEVKTRIENIPLLDDRLEQLNLAVAQHPAVVVFQDLREVTKKKRDTVIRLTEKAQMFEKSERLLEAAELWGLAAATCPEIEGLRVNLERVVARIDSKQRAEFFTRLASDVEFYLDTGAYEKAGDLILELPAEARADESVQDLELKIKERLDTRAEAVQLLREGRMARESGDWERAAEAFSEAARLEPNDQEIRSEYLYAAKQISPASVVAPGSATLLRHEVPRTSHPLRSPLTDPRTDTSAAAAAAELARQARQLLRSDDLNGAIRVVNEGLAIAPGHSELLRLNQEINNRFHGLTGPPSAPLGRTNELMDRVQGILAGQNQGESNKPSGAASSHTDQIIELLFGSEKTLTAVPTNPSPDVAQETLPRIPTDSHVAPAPPPAEPPADHSGRAFPLRLWNWANNAPRGVVLGISALLVFVVLASAAVIYQYANGRKSSDGAAQLHGIAVTGAHIGEFQVVDQQGKDWTDQIGTGLPPGTYVVRAARRGYKPIQHPVTVPAGAGQRSLVALQWERLPTALRVHVSGNGGALLVDQKPVNLGPSGEFLADWQEGFHSVTWKRAGLASIEFGFEVREGEVFAVTSKLEGSAVVALGVTINGAQLKYQSLNSSGIDIALGSAAPYRGKIAGVVPLTPGKRVSFRTSYGNSLGSFTIPDSGGSAAFVEVLPWHAPSPAPNPGAADASGNGQEKKP